MKQFPIVRAEGSHYEVGVVIGQQLRQKIDTLLAKNRKLIESRLGVLIARSKNFLAQGQRYFPQYLRELRGIADGANVSFDELFLANCLEVANYDSIVYDAKHCTIIGFPMGHGYVLGHNEDALAYTSEDLYLLDAVINGTRILGLNYMDSLIGPSVAVNGFGLAQAINELFYQPTRVGVPKNLIARAVLDCQTLADVEQLMERIPRGSGYNHVLIQGDQLWNAETTAGEFVIEKFQGRKHIHTNHYVTQLKKEVERATEESILRYNKVQSRLAKMHTIGDIKRVLSDRHDPRVCRKETIGSVIVDSTNRVAHIAYGQPTPGAYVEHSLKHVIG